MLMTEDLISYIANEYFQTTRKYIGKTKLLKLVYLTDLYHYRKYHQIATNIEWFYYKFGPYDFSFDERLAKSKIEFYENDEKYENGLIKPIDDQLVLEELKQKINIDIRFIIKNVLSDFSFQDLSEILNYIYFDTEPMLSVKERGEKLNFECCLPFDKYIVKAYVLKNDKVNEIKQKYKGQVNAVRKL